MDQWLSCQEKQGDDTPIMSSKLVATTCYHFCFIFWIKFHEQQHHTFVIFKDNDITARSDSYLGTNQSVNELELRSLLQNPIDLKV